MKTLIVGIYIAIASPSLAQDDLMKDARAAFKPVPSLPPELKGNPSNPQKIELGRMLFFDPTGCRQVGSSVVTPVTTLASAVWMVWKPLLVMGGKRGHATVRQF
jgi:hypothetical protein